MRVMSPYVRLSDLSGPNKTASRKVAQSGGRHLSLHIGRPWFTSQNHQALWTRERFLTTVF